jgi:hypothetical protein
VGATGGRVSGRGGATAATSTRLCRWMPVAVCAIPGGNTVPITAFDGVNHCCLGGQLLLEGGPDKFHPLLASESLGAITAA